MICLQNRKGTIHYISWKTSRLYYVMCGKTLATKNGKYNVYSVDGVIPGVCSECQDAARIFIDNEKKASRGDLLEINVYIYTDAIKKYTAPENRYGSLLRRNWELLRQLKYSRKK
jgi:hypothetical protein